MTKYSKHHGRPHKNKDELAARIDAKLREMRLHAGPDQFDPVVLMAAIGAEAYAEKDVQVALVAFREVAQYVRPKLAAAPPQEETEHTGIVSRARVLGAFARMGVKVEADPQRLVEDIMTNEGLTYEQAAQRVEEITGISISDVATQALPPPDDD